MRTLFLTGLFLMLYAVIPANAADGEWAPDMALITQIEAKFAPSMSDGSLTDIGGRSATASEPFDHYARFYAGETVNGEKVVVGSFIYGFGEEKPGIQIVTMEHLPGGAGGGCNMIHIWYHVATQRIESVCNFPM